MSKQLNILDEVQDNFQELQNNYSEAVMIIDDQKNQIQKLDIENEDLGTRNGQLDDELKDIQSMLHDQQRIYSSHINELRSQLNDLEDATKGKYEEQVMSLQLELKLKNDQYQRANSEREQCERKLKQKLDEMGMSTH